MLDRLDWATCTDPLRMLEWVEGKASDRKLRLFACACARRFWDRLQSQAVLAVVESERFADGLTGAEKLAAARQAAEESEFLAAEFVQLVQPVATAAADEDAREAARATIDAARRAAWYDGAYEGVPGIDVPQSATAAADAERRALCDVARHVFGDPFLPVRIDPRWLSWDDGVVPKLARLVYADGSAQDMLILADALEEAGCADEELLGHCRTPQRHPRGCWVLDLLLGLS